MATDYTALVTYPDSDDRPARDGEYCSRGYDCREPGDDDRGHCGLVDASTGRCASCALYEATDTLDAHMAELDRAGRDEEWRRLNLISTLIEQHGVELLERRWQREAKAKGGQP